MTRSFLVQLVHLLASVSKDASVTIKVAFKAGHSVHVLFLDIKIILFQKYIFFAFTFHCCLDVQNFPDLQYGMMFVHEILKAIISASIFDEKQN